MFYDMKLNLQEVDILNIKSWPHYILWFINGICYTFIAIFILMTSGINHSFSDLTVDINLIMEENKH